MRGLSKDLIRQISRFKQEPEWMLNKRLESYEVFLKKPMPEWGADLDSLDFNDFTYFKKPKTGTVRNWDRVDKKTKLVFEKLGVPEAERKVLAGAGAQWDSGVIYQNLKAKLLQQGVIFLSMDEAVKQQPVLVKKYFMTKIVRAENNKLAALHGAVWSGGSFVYVPEKLQVKEPLQAYFYLDLKSGGQFEHTLIVAEQDSGIEFIEGCSAPRYSQNSLHVGCVEIMVGKKARVRYSTVQNWSKNVYNLATKRAIVEEKGLMEWVSGSLGSKATMVYPCSVLRGRGAKAVHLSLSLANKGQELDSGGKAIHVGAETSSNIIAKSISKDGGKTSFRGLVKVLKGARGSKTNMSCESLMMDDDSKANTYPQMEIDEDEVTAMHEAKTGKVAEEELVYLMSRGISEQEAMGMIVNGMIEPIVSKLPLEYAVEVNRLIELEMEGSIG